MFHLTVTQNDTTIQQREYWTALECVSKFAAAHEYYRNKGEEVLVSMLDSREIIIITKKSTEELHDGKESQ